MHINTMHKDAEDQIVVGVVAIKEQGMRDKLSCIAHCCSMANKDSIERHVDIQAQNGMMRNFPFIRLYIMWI